VTQNEVLWHRFAPLFLALVWRWLPRFGQARHRAQGRRPAARVTAGAP